MSDPSLKGGKCVCQNGQEVNADDCSASEAGGNGGTGGTSADPEPAPVFSWGQLDNEPSLDPGEWEVDGTLEPGAGRTAVHPPKFDAGDSFDFTFDCGRQEHSQLRFLLAHDGSVKLSLQVSGEAEPRVLPQSVGFNLGHGYFAEQVLNVEPGPHSYTFTASSGSDAAPGVRLDAFKCLQVAPFSAKNSHVDFDDRFIPSEIKGDWQVDNLLGVGDGDAAIHPPAFVAGDTYSFDLTCEAEDHSQLRFLLAHDGEVELALQVSDEDKPRVVPQSVGFNVAHGYYAEQAINVKPGPHTYTFVAHAAKDAAPSVRLDAFQCVSVEPFAAENGVVDFDDQFIPIETTGDWHVDNLLGVGDGDTAIHPPAFDGGETYTLKLTCDAEDHKGLRFLLAHEGGVELGLQVSGEDEPRVLPQSVGFNLAHGYFAEQVVDGVEAGPRTYTFTATSASASSPRVRLDALTCE